MKTNKFVLRLFSLAMALIMIFGMFGLSALAADESSFVAEFKILTDKLTAKKDEEIEVSVLLKTNYYICAMSIIAVYDCEAFTMQNTSESNKSGFLTFKGSMADCYRTNGNWKSGEDFYTRRNSNPDYWSQADIMAKYKFAYASWSADTSVSYELIKLDEEETVVTFVLKANKDIDDMSGLIFISNDFQKTASSRQGLLFVGRSTTKEFAIDSIVEVGQTIVFSGLNPSAIPPSISPADGTNTVIDKQNGLIYGLEEGTDNLDSFVKVEGYTLKYTYLNNFFGTGTRVDCLLDGEVKETYYIVIFGDVTGDGVIDTFDISLFAAVINGDIEIDGAMSIAADVYYDETVDTFDYAVVSAAVNGDIVISQTNK